MCNVDRLAQERCEIKAWAGTSKVFFVVAHGIKNPELAVDAYKALTSAGAQEEADFVNGHYQENLAILSVPLDGAPEGFIAKTPTLK